MTAYPVAPTPQAAMAADVRRARTEREARGLAGDHAVRFAVCAHPDIFTDLDALEDRFGEAIREGWATRTSLAAACDGSSSPPANQADASPPASQTASSDAPETPVPAFQASFVPPASGEGNFEVCLSADAKENDIARVVVPARMIFQSWGQLTGDLQKTGSYDLNTTSGSRRKDEKTSYAVVLEQPVTLTPAKPCRRAKADAVTHEGFGFSHDVVPVELHLAFQADVLMETASQDITNSDPPGDKTTTDALGEGLVNGTPVANVEHVRQLHSSDD